MPSLKEMRNRIGSVKATQKITKAMQMVAAAKLKRAQDAAQNARPYAQRMGAVIANLAAGVSGDGAPRLLAGTGSNQRQLVIVATADRGLAGGFNSGIVRLAQRHLARLVEEGMDVRVLPVGRKATEQLRRQFGDRYVGSFEAGNSPSLTRAEEIATRVLELFEAGQVDVVTLIYSQFKSVVTQTPTVRQLVPAEVETDAAQPKVDLRGAAYEYEPDEGQILETLLPRNVTVQLFSAMLENQAGFFAAQMTAMDNATRNAGDMIANLTLQYNRSRQAQITKELIEIISGAEAV